MKVSELKTKFIDELGNLYPSEEIQSFFTILSEKFLKFNRFEISLNRDLIVSEENIEKFNAATLGLKQYKPIQYIIGETEFYGLPFKVNKHTLIPRPETEELVDWIINDQAAFSAKTCTILDIGTGTGCIAICLAKNIDKSQVSALDFSEEALIIAKINARLNAVAVDFFQEDILKSENLSEKYNVIVSNPPYVRELEKNNMQENVLQYEPASALYVSDNDPLIFYRKIAQLAKKHLSEEGFLYFEINEYLSKELVEMLENEGFSENEVRQDILGKDRMIKSKLHA